MAADHRRKKKKAKKKKENTPRFPRVMKNLDFLEKKDSLRKEETTRDPDT